MKSIRSTGRNVGRNAGRTVARAATITAITGLTALTGLLAPAHAAFQVNDVEFTCNGDLSLSGVDAFTLSCSADLRLQGLSSGAFIEAPESISVFAGGHLSLAGLRLTSPLIELHSQTAVTLGNDVVVLATAPTGGNTSPEVRISAGEVRLGTDRTWADATRQGGSISIGTSGDVRLSAGSDIGLGGNAQLLEGGRLQISSVPEPTSAALLLGGLVAVGAMRASGAISASRRRRA